LDKVRRRDLKSQELQIKLLEEEEEEEEWELSTGTELVLGCFLPFGNLAQLLLLFWVSKLSAWVLCILLG
jgi:hypothetical protein